MAPNAPASDLALSRAAIALLALLATAAPASAEFLYPHVPCYARLDKKTWVQYPPGCPRGFTSHAGILIIRDGLPPGANILGRLSFSSFNILSDVLGGPLGGEITQLEATARFEMQGTGAFAGYSRTLLMPVTMVLHTGFQQTGTDVRTFAVDVDQLFGLLTLDSDFALLRITAGTSYGLPLGSPVLVDIEIRPMTLVSTAPGGPLGGERQTWDARVVLQLTGVGIFAGYSRSISIVSNVVTATAPIVTGYSPQHFETQLLELLGSLPIGDPDFDLLRITGGSSFGFPGPGHTSYTHAGGSQWNVDSFFDIAYRLDFIGSFGGPLVGMSGSTSDRQRFLAGEHPTLATPPGEWPSALEVSPARPNPARDGAAVTLALPRRSAVRLVVHDLAGRLIRVVEDGTREACVHTLAWDGRGASGASVSPGLYLLRKDADGTRFTRRLIVTR